MTIRTQARCALLAALLICGPGSHARRFSRALSEVRAAAFYRVLLPPQVSAISGTELTSLRLRDAQGREQPYLVQRFSGPRAQRAGIRHNRVAVPVAGFSQTDSSDKQSYIHIAFDEAYPIDTLQLWFGGPRYFSRVLRLPAARPGWERRIDQRQDAAIAGPFRSRDILVVIGNDDNPPLQVAAVEASQSARYLTAWLEPGIYSLVYDDSAAIAPRYDIGVLADSLAAVGLTQLSAGEPVELSDAVVVSPEPAVKRDPQPAAGHFRAALIWTIIGALLIAITFATRALARRIGSARQDEA